MVILKSLTRCLFICPIGWFSTIRSLQLGTSSRGRLTTSGDCEYVSGAD